MEIENASNSVRTDEYTETRNENTKNKIFSLPEGVSQTPGINFDKYNKVTVKMTGANVPKEVTSFEQLDLHHHVLKNVKDCKYT